MSVSIDRAICAGCHLCELACSFHHHGHFSPRFSSIWIDKDPVSREIEPFVYRDDVDGRPACDDCADLQHPLCAANCPANAISVLENPVVPEARQ